MVNLDIKDIVKTKKGRKCLNGATAYNINGDLILIYETGRIERVKYAKVLDNPKYLNLRDLDVELIDKGLII